MSEDSHTHGSLQLRIEIFSNKLSSFSATNTTNSSSSRLILMQLIEENRDYTNPLFLHPVPENPAFFSQSTEELVIYEH